MQIENRCSLVNKLENPTIEVTSVRNILSNSSASEANIGDLSWLDRQLDPNRENQNSLQEKIICLYQAIEKKTIKNIQIKKNNEVLRGQVEAYISIIQKIRKASESAKITELQRVPTIETRSSRESVVNYEGNEDSKTQIEHEDNLNQYNFSNQTFHHDQEVTPREEMKDYKSPEWQRHSLVEYKDQNKIKSQKSTPVTSIINLVNEKNVDQQRVNHMKGNIKTGIQNWNSSYDQNICNNILDQRRERRKNSEGKSSTNYNRNFEYSDASNSSDYPFPRPSIDMNIQKLTSPNKSFLKKASTQNMSTGNLATKYSNVDIQSLWNESKSPNCKFTVQNKMKSPKGPAKIQMTVFRQDGNRKDGKMNKYS